MVCVQCRNVVEGAFFFDRTFGMDIGKMPGSFTSVRYTARLQGEDYARGDVLCWGCGVAEQPKTLRTLWGTLKP